MIDQEQLPAIHNEMNLFDIVQALVASDEGSLVLTDEQHSQLSTIIRTKVDGCVLFRREVMSEIERHQEFADAHAARAKTLKNQLGRFEDYVKNVMISKSFEKLPGEEFEITITNPPGALEISGEPTEDDFEHMPEFVTKAVKFSWNKVGIKKAIDANTYPLSNAQIVKNRKVKFDIKKGRK